MLNSSPCLPVYYFVRLLESRASRPPDSATTEIDNRDPFSFLPRPHSYHTAKSENLGLAPRRVGSRFKPSYAASKIVQRAFKSSTQNKRRAASSFFLAFRLKNKKPRNQGGKEPMKQGTTEARNQGIEESRNRWIKESRDQGIKEASDQEHKESRN